MWNLNLGYIQTYLQGRERDVHIEKRDVETEGEREVGTNWYIRIRTDIHTLPCVKQTASRKLLSSTGSSAQCRVMT